MRPKLKVPATNPLTLKYDEPVSNLAFKINLGRYAEVRAAWDGGAAVEGAWSEVGRCRLNR
jgi:hypothetical protein